MFQQLQHWVRVYLLCASSQGHSERQAGIVSLYHLYSSEMDERCTQEFTIDESNYRCSSELPEARLSGGFVFLHPVDSVFLVFVLYF